MPTRDYTAKGWLTPYALGCGDIHHASIPGKRGIDVTLKGTACPGVYQVQTYSFETGERRYIDYFRSLALARRAYSKQVREYFPVIPRHWCPETGRKVYS